MSLTRFQNLLYSPFFTLLFFPKFIKLFVTCFHDLKSFMMLNIFSTLSWFNINKHLFSIILGFSPSTIERIATLNIFFLLRSFSARYVTFPARGANNIFESILPYNVVKSATAIPAPKASGLPSSATLKPSRLQSQSCQMQDKITHCV